MDLSGLGRSTNGNENDATNKLRGMGINNPSSGLVRWVAHGEQGYGAEEAQRHNLPGWQQKVASDQANAAKAESARIAAEQRARTDEFTTRVQGIPAALRAVEEEVGLPGARATYQSAGEASRDIAGQIRDVAPTQRVIAKQVGISAPRLALRTAAETTKLAPGLETATRGLEEAQAGLSGVLGNFQTRAENILAPFQIEAGILGDSVKNEFDLFKTTTRNSLDREIALLQESGLNDRAALDRASKLAEAEKASLEGKFQDLGDRVVLVNNSGQIIQSFLKGLAPTKGAAAKRDL